MNRAKLLWPGVVLIAISLLLLPFALSYAGTAWVRIANFAMLYVLLNLAIDILYGVIDPRVGVEA